MLQGGTIYEITKNKKVTGNWIVASVAKFEYLIGLNCKTTSTTYTPSFVRLWKCHVKIFAEMIWIDSCVDCTSSVHAQTLKWA